MASATQPEPELEYDVLGITKVIRPPVDLSGIPPAYLLKGHLKPPEYQKLKDKLRLCRCPLMEIASHARVFIVNVSSRPRCELELRKCGLVFVTPELEAEGDLDINTFRPLLMVKFAWFEESFRKRNMEKFDAYKLLEGEMAALPKRRMEQTETKSVSAEEVALEKKRKEVMERALADAAEVPARKKARYVQQKQVGIDAILDVSKRRPLLRRSTSSFEGKYPSGDLPEWVVKKVTCYGPPPPS